MANPDTAYAVRPPKVDNNGRGAGGRSMQSRFGYLVAALEVWLGVFGILLGLYTLMSFVGISTERSPGVETILGFTMIICGGVLVADAIRRELSARAFRKMEALGNPLDTPTQA
jgi:hypothetical protein